MWDIILNITLVFAFVFLNAFFVAAEFAIVKVRMTQIEPLAAQKDWRAQMAKEVISHLDTYLSASQVGITMTSLALGWIGEPFVANLLRPLFDRIGLTNPDAIQAIAFGVAFSIITILHIVLGEQAPKWLAIQRPRSATLFVAYPLRIFYVVFRPFIWFVNTLANAVVRGLGIHTVGEAELTHSEEELRLLLAQDKRVSVASKSIVLNAMDFRRKQARHSMVPRTEMMTLSLSAPVQENINIMRTNKFSRYPVYRDSIDNIIGVIYTKDIFKQDRHLKVDFTLESVLRDATFLPETANLERVLETILLRKTHMVILADEYGGTAGLITLENVLEELVGPIQDEFDRESPEVTKVSDDEYVLDASLTTNDVERLISQELSPKDILSIGGFVLEQLGHIPQKGESVQVNGVEFTVEQVNDRVIDRVRVRRIPPPKDDETGEQS
jgi:CBS domain containing-hemolysin-like protein